MKLEATAPRWRRGFCRRLGGRGPSTATRGARSLALSAVFALQAWSRAGVATPEPSPAPHGSAWRAATLTPQGLVPVIVRLRRDAREPAWAPAPRARAPTRAKPAERRALVRGLSSRGAARRSSVRERWERRGAQRARPLWTIHALALDVPPELLHELAQSVEVERVDLDRFAVLPSVQLQASPSLPWTLEAIGVGALRRAGLWGEGAVVASLDTGADLSHPALAGSYLGSNASWFDPYAQYPSPVDNDGHGTQSLGVVVGDAGQGTPGVAPRARWMASKIFDDQGRAAYSAIHEAFQWLLDPDGDPDTDDAPHVVSNAWAIPDALERCDDEFDEDLRLLAEAGISVMFAAGNGGPAASTGPAPAHLAGVISVGAVDADFVVHRQSSRGPNACDGSPYPSVVAPGIDVLTLDLTYGGLLPDSVVSASGTSVAVGHVVGAFALLRGAFPQRPFRDIEAALLSTAQDLDPPGPDQASGAGVIDVAAAYTQLQLEFPPEHEVEP